MTENGRQTNGTRHRTLTRASELARIDSEWDALVHAMGRPSPFLLSGRLLAWWDAFGTSATMRVEAAFDGERLVAALPIEVRRRAGVRVARLMGGEHAPLADFVALQGTSDRILSALVDRAGAGADYLRFFGFVPGSSLGRVLGRPGACIVERVRAPAMDLAGGWQASYLRNTKARHRHEHARRERRLSELGELEYRVARSEDDLLAAYEALVDLHRRCWEGRVDRSVLAHPRGVSFEREALRRVAASGAVRIVTLTLDGVALAAQYCFLVSRSLILHRLAWEPGYAKYAPGRLVTLKAIELAADDGATRVEFLGGLEAPKMTLADTTDSLLEYVSAGTTLRGRVAAGASRGLLHGRLRMKESERARALHQALLSRVPRRGSSGPRAERPAPR